MIKNLLSNYPVRVYGYTVTVALLGLLVALGVVSAGTVPFIVTLAAAVLSIPATEAVHNSVTPTAKLGVTPPTK